MSQRHNGKAIPLSVSAPRAEAVPVALVADSAPTAEAASPDAGLHAAEVFLHTRGAVPLALDVRHSRLYRLSDAELAVLRLAGPVTAEGARVALADQFDAVDVDAAVARLRERGLLLDAAARRQALPRGPLTRLELGVAEDCNLRCPYCFVSQGSFGGPRRVMPMPIAERAVRLLFDEAGDEPLLQIGFYGGEPLLNIPVVRKVIELASARAKAAGKQIRFDLITNGTRIDAELAAFFRKHNVAIQISLDGPKETNDAIRPRLGGQGSYQAATAPIAFLEDYSLLQGRATLTKANPEADTIVDHLLDLGMPSVVARPVVGAEGGLGLDEPAARRIAEGYEALAARVLEADTDAEAARRAAPFLGYFAKIMEGQPRRVPCQQAAWAVACAADGTLYPCKDMAAKPEYAIGVVWKGIDWEKAYNTDTGKLLCQQIAPKKAECATCWGRELCQISCMHVCLEPKGGAEGDAEYSGWECWIQLNIIETALGLFEALRERRPTVFWLLLQRATGGALPPPAALAG